jgi:ArsR family transcriptional regulator
MRSNIQSLKQELDSNEALEQCARQCGIIGDVTKLKICYILNYYPDLNVGTIAELTGTSISNVSHSLSKLKSANLVKCKREGQTVCYSLIDNEFTKTLLELAK